MGSRSRAFWLALQAVHGEKNMVEELPNLPCTITVTRKSTPDEDEDEDAGCGQESMQAGRPQPGPRARDDANAPTRSSGEGPPYTFEFTGGPCDFFPMLKGMVRFARPFITWDIWNEAPPLQFPAKARPSNAARPEGTSQGRKDGGASSSAAHLRNPDEVNSVRTKDNAAEFDAAKRRMEAASWLEGDGHNQEEDPHEKEGTIKIRKDGLYIVHGPPDGELSLGLVQVTSDPSHSPDLEPTDVPYVQVGWFQRSSKQKRVWPQNPGFKWWPTATIGKKRSTNWITSDSFLVEVKRTDLTDGTREEPERTSTPRLNKSFMDKLMALAKSRNLWTKEVEEHGDLDQDESWIEEDEEMADEMAAAGEEEKSAPDKRECEECDEECEEHEKSAADEEHLDDQDEYDRDDEWEQLEKEVEIQGCTDRCDYPCMRSCGKKWDRCFLLKVEKNSCTVRMLDNEVIHNIHKRNIREVGGGSDHDATTTGRASRARRAAPPPP